MVDFVTQPLTEEDWLENYAPDWAKDPSLPDSLDMCTQCKLFCEATGKMWPPCGNQDLNRAYQWDLLSMSGSMGHLDNEEQLDLHLETDPVLWASLEFEFDNTPWIPRWYQSLFMRCTAPKRAALWGRRSGKSECMLVYCLYYAFFRVGAEGADRDYRIQCFVNSDALAKKHWSEMKKFINAGRNLKYMIVGGEKGKSIELNNNVTIQFNVLSDKQLGQSAYLMWFDEAAFYNDDEAFAHAMAIAGERSKTPVIMTSNSSGFRGKFYEYCQQEDTYLLQLPSYVNPNWDTEMELFARQNYSQQEYEVLIEAKWGQSQAGVFRPEDIKYMLDQYPYSYADVNRPKNHEHYRVMGCDWNEAANGVHFVVVEYIPKYKTGNPLYKVVHKSVARDKDFNHTTALNRAYQILMEWHCDAAYLDAGGGGSMNVEHLKIRLMKEGHGKLAQRIHPVSMAAMEKIPDLGGVDGVIPKRTKNLMVGICQRLLEQHCIAIPEEEDYAVGQAVKNNNIIPQMRDFRVEKVDNRGFAVYSSDLEEHTLTAWMLAVFGSVLDNTDIISGGVNYPVAFADREKMPTEEAMEQARMAETKTSENTIENDEDPTFGPARPARSKMPGWNRGGIGSRTRGFGRGGGRTW